MTASVVEFRRRASEEFPSSAAIDKFTKSADVIHLIPDSVIFQNILEEFLVDWNSASRHNRLAEYILKKLPQHLHGHVTVNLTNDLNAVALIEQKLGMRREIFSPASDNTGWKVTFFRGESSFSTPSTMPCECTARALSILLFVYFDHAMTSLGRF